MKCISTLLLTFLCLPLFAQQSENMLLLGQWNDASLLFNRVRYNDVWGYAAGGREYALLGSREYTLVLDVTDPALITEIARIAADPVDNLWRDIKVYQDHAYFIKEDGEGGLSAIDLSELPNHVELAFSDNTYFNKGHNLLVDNTSVPARLYVFGVETGRPGRGGAVVYSLADPGNPVHLASIELGGYIHDGYARGDTLYANHGRLGLYIYDLSDLNDPVELGRLESYQESGYNHSSWLTDNGNSLVFCDETFDKGVKILNVENVNDAYVESIFRSTLIPGQTRSIAHNPYVLGDSLVVLSYYDEGLQVWDISNPLLPFRVGYYDTTPGQTSYSSDGVWGAYPYLPSGNILASDQETGLYILRLGTATLPVTYSSLAIRADKRDAVLDWTTGEEDDNAGWTVERSRDGDSFLPLGRVLPDGGQTYAYRDISPGSGNFFYRLRQEDLDGTANYSDLLSVSFESTAACYPNPARAGQTVHWGNTGGDGARVQSELYDGFGRRVSVGPAEAMLLPPTLPAGLYTLRRTDSGETVTLVVD